MSGRSSSEVITGFTIWDSSAFDGNNAFSEPLDGTGPCACCGSPDGETYHYKQGFRCAPCAFGIDCPIGKCDQP